ncbi:MAG: delta-60 repeat domain-containing protein, partial [Desulfofustis sp.]|nr:delta-60 repeat domain-containing protein [Desulfofustis sp.]
MNRIFQSVTWMLLFLSGLSGTAVAQSLLVANDEFGSGGLVLTDLGSGFDEALAIAVLADGRVVVAGSSDNGIDRDLAVVRYLPDGGIDPSFVFSAGPVIGAALGDDVARALTLLEDGSLVLAGSITENGSTAAVLVKLLENGQLDYRFGDQGVVVYRPVGENAIFHDLHRLADGTLIAAGTRERDNEPSPVLARFSADGSIDPAFGGDGIESFAEVRGELYGVAVDASGSLYGCGYSLDESGRSGVLLVRLSTAPAAPIGGAFGESGVITLFDDDEETVAHDIAVQGDGRLVIAGAARPAAGGSSVLVGRFASDGTPDREVADNGLLVYDMGPDSAAYGIAVLADDTALAAGYHQDESGRDLMVLQFDATLAPIGEPNTLDQAGSISGALAISALIVEDGAFSPSAVAVGGTSRQATLLTTAVEGSDETGLAIVVDSGGTVFTAGTSGGTEQSSILVA